MSDRDDATRHYTTFQGARSSHRRGIFPGMVRRAKLCNATTVFLVGNIEPTMEWYKQLGFEPEYFPPGFAMLQRDEIRIFLQQHPGYAAPADRARCVGHLHRDGRCTSVVRRILSGFAQPDIASALPPGIRHAGIRGHGSERPPPGIRAAGARAVA